VDINKWKSLAVRKEDHTKLCAIAKSKKRGPGAQFSKILDEYIKVMAKRKNQTVEAYVKSLLNGSAK
tara:strand:+ start:21 stop:221 length:201 start_codon:yes stop_codon:yes gene_type:complete